MQKIGDTTKTADSNGEFTDGDPQKQIPCTWIMAAWLNTLQRELIKVVQAGGLTLDPNDDTQLYQAIEKLMEGAVEGMVKTVNTHEPDANGNVKLGTAADADIGTDAGNVLEVGAFGLSSSLAGQADVDLNDIKNFGFYIVRNASNAPLNDVGVLYVSVQSWLSGTGSDTNRAVQTVYSYANKNRMFCRTYFGPSSGWSAWVEFFSDAHKPTAANTGALPLTGGTMLNEVKSTSPNIWRGIQGDYGSIWRMDANNSYFLLTNKGDPNGNFNNLRPLGINNDTGAVSVGTSLSVDSLSSIYKTGINAYSDGGNNYNQTHGITLQGVGDQVGEMYFLENIGKYAALCFHIKSGGRDGWVEFRNDGNFYINGTNVAPVGVIEAWPSDTPPQGWLICDGSGFNTGAFPNLAQVFPSGQLPDLRGAFLRGNDNGKGIDPGRWVLSTQQGQAPASAIAGRGWGDYAQRDTGHTSDTGTDSTGHYSVKQETEAQRETRPYNVSVNYIVRAA